MKELLFIGGSNDGRRIKVPLPLLPIYKLPIQSEKDESFIDFNGKDHSVNVLRIEEYRCVEIRDYIYNHHYPIFICVHSSINSAITKLIEGYRI